MTRLISFLVLGAILALTSCQKNSPPPAQSQATPSDVSSSAQVVKVFGHFIPKAAGAPANVELEITPGFHVNANPATFSYLIATEVQPGKVDGITVGKIAYPAGVPQKFAFADQPLSVYEGKVTIPIPITVAPGAKGQRLLPLKLRVQACDTEKCLPPATLDSAVTINVDALRQ
jgi:DsbC/DsbD-like thiol-disulfide interchange protein